MKKITTLLLILIFVGQAKAQVDANLERLRTVVPPSPNASAIAKYGEWPVSLYTGVPNINVPLCELKGRSVTVPVSLSYHASGIKVGEVASWVGLGWSLNAGGVITRSIRGLPDEENYFYASANYTDPNNFCSGPVNQTNASNQVCLVANGKADSQMDIYTFSAMGKSYNLIISADGTVYTRPYSNIKITTPFFNNQDYWKVILEDGTILIFGGGNNYVETTVNTRFGLDGAGGSYTSAWQLKSITTAYGEAVNFNYSNPNGVDQDAQITQSDYIKYRNNINVATHSGTSTHAERQSVLQSYLSSIESENTRIEFIANNAGRQDLKAGATLSEIKIYSKLASKYIDDYTFNYTYSSSYPGSEYTSDLLNDTSFIHHRLKLSGISHNGNPGDKTLVPQSWVFEYNPTLLPSRRSFAQDHWGFYNGAITNTSLLPRVFISSPVTPVSSYVSQDGFTPSNNHDIGGLRYSDESAMQAESLTKITYPTGGQSQFTYEANSSYVNKEALIDTTANFHIYTTANQATFVNSLTYNFTVTQPQYVKFFINGSISSSILRDYPSAQISIKLISLDSNATVFSYSGNGTPWINILKKGNYQLVIGSNTTADNFVTSNDYIDISASISYLSSHGIQNVKTLYGGLRIKSITDSDAITNIPKTKNYLYDSAFVINPIDTLNDYTTVQQMTDASTNYYSKVTRNTSTKFSLGSVQGGTVGYGLVTVISNNSNDDGKTVYHYTNVSDAATDNAKLFPYPPTDSRDWRRGLLLDETTYNANGVPLKITSNSYSFIGKFSATNYAAGFAEIWYPSFCANIVSGSQCCGIVSACYPVSTEQVLHNATTETIYDQNGQNPSTISTNYYYDNPNNVLPIRSESYDSKGNLIKTVSRTALEKNDINNAFTVVPTFSSAIDTMVNRNMVGEVLQQEQYLNSNLLKRVTSQQKLWSNNYVQTEKVSVQKGNNAPEYRIQYNQYDGDGNINEQQKVNDVKETYLWAYNSTYPVAKIIGSDYATVSSVVSQSQIDASIANDDNLRTVLNTLRTDSRTSASLITTYTYAPSIGMTSSTDPSGKITYYEYDGFNRLHIIRDQNHNIVREFCYGYKGDTTACAVMYMNLVASRGFQKNDCAAGGTPSTVIYTVAAGTYYSYVSQADADQKAQSDINTNGQAYANSHGTCTFSSVAKSGSFQKNDCATGGVGSSVTYTVIAGAYSSTISQADADNQAQNDVNTNGQAYANGHGTCTFSSVAKSGSFQKNDCATGGVGSSVTYSVAANTYTSTISQADADNKAQNDVNTNGQAYANSHGTCTFSNAVKSGTFQKNDCATGGVGSNVTYTVAAGIYSSTISQADADNQAQNDVNTNGQAYANNHGTCTFSSTVKSGTFQRNNCATGGVGSNVTYTVAAGAYSSTISQADADQQAINDVNANGQTYANNNGTCTFYNVAKSSTYQKNNCATGGTGSNVTYTVNASTYSSTISQADADQKAINDVAANGQTYANNNGTCTFYNVVKSGTYQKNNCATGGTGSNVTYTVNASTYSSTISQADADQKAINDVAVNGQTYANNNGTCTFYNVAKSSTYQKNNCATGGTGSNVTYTVNASTYSSIISQADADQKAVNDVTANGQTYANSNGICTFYNVVKSGTYQKNNCATGGTGSSVIYTVNAGVYSSTTGQADADSKAQTDVNNNGQTYANNNGYCTFYNVVKSGTFQRNNCATGGTGSNVTYTVNAGKYSSTISQADADSKAQTDVNNNGQAYANNNGICTFYNVAKSGTFQKNNCATGGTGSYVTYTVNASVYSSTISQADADSKAQTDVNNNGQTYANNNGYCTFYNVVKSGTYQKNNCATGGTGSYVTYTVNAGAYSSTISQADADSKAQTDVNNNGQTYANNNGYCTFYNVVMSGTYQKNNCATGGTGAYVTYTVAAHVYSSTISQADADSKAQIDVNNNGQTYANNSGYCTFYNVVKSGTYQKNNCATGGTGSYVAYTVAAHTYSSTVSQADADSKAQTDVNNNGQAYANNNGYCTFYSAAKSGTYQRNNCATGGTGSYVTYTVNASAYSSTVSQADADSKAQTDVNNNGQTFANNNGYCTFYSAAKSGTFQKNNCATGGTGSYVTYTVNASAYSSTVSQADADSKAQTDVNNNGQTFANNNGYCTFYSAAKSGTFQKNNCTTGGTGSYVTYTVNASAYNSTISQTDADSKAQTDVNNNGQAYANNNGYCTFYNTVHWGTFQKNDCATGGTGSSVTYAVGAGAYSSTTSQADADNKAQNDVNANGQTYANNNGYCTFYNTAISGTFQKNNCSTGGTGSNVTYSVPAGKYSSTVSQNAADDLAWNELNSNGQINANNNGYCLYYSDAQSATFQKNDCAAGGTGSMVTYSLPAGSYASTVSKADANQRATDDINTNGQSYANYAGYCTFYNAYKSGTFTRNNCPANTTPGQATYAVNAGTYSSTVSQADADQQAINDVNANGQNYANANASCAPQNVYATISYQNMYTSFDGYTTADVVLGTYSDYYCYQPLATGGITLYYSVTYDCNGSSGYANSVYMTDASLLLASGESLTYQNPWCYGYSYYDCPYPSCNTYYILNNGSGYIPR